MSRRPIPPATVWCPVCHRQFPDLWAYKAHQDACIAARRADRERKAS